MRPTGKLKMVIMAIVVILSCGTANAQRWRRYHHPYRVVTVVSRPAVTVHVSNLSLKGNVSGWQWPIWMSMNISP